MSLPVFEVPLSALRKALHAWNARLFACRVTSIASIEPLNPCDIPREACNGVPIPFSGPLDASRQALPVDSEPS